VLMVSGTAVVIAVAVAIRPHPKPAADNSTAGSPRPTARATSPVQSATPRV
jgi:hypothetical protein